jgi:hypothetical protein
MYKERRTHIIPPENWIGHQTAEWKWDSHLWVKREDGQLACDWCGWIVPSEWSKPATALCPKNPEVINVIKIFKDAVEEFLLDFTTKMRNKFDDRYGK